MEKHFQDKFAKLRKDIAENKLMAGKLKFKEQIKSDTFELFHAGFSESFLENSLGLSKGTLQNWRRRSGQSFPTALRLPVVESSVTAKAENSTDTPNIVSAEKIEVLLPNGVILKGVTLNVNSLDLLGGLT